LWKNGPWDLPSPGKRAARPAEEEKLGAKTAPLAGTDVIISKNLFDPERGEGRTREVEVSSKSFQRVRGMVLLGTAILGDNRYAVLREQGPGGTPGQAVSGGQPQSVVRLKLGDDVEGFRLTDIGDKRVVFTKGASRVEVPLDYFRKAETPAPRVPAATQPRRIERGVVPGPIPAPGQPATPAQGAAVNPAPAPGQVGPATPLPPRVIPSLPRRERVPVPRRNESLSED
jgi:hypothetical protein